MSATVRLLATASVLSAMVMAGQAAADVETFPAGEPLVATTGGAGGRGSGGGAGQLSCGSQTSTFAPLPSDSLCAVVIEPSGSMDDQRLVFLPQDRRGHPDAGQPDYVYLIAGREAVMLFGPPVDADVLDCHGPTPRITRRSRAEGSAMRGFDVDIGPRLRYVVRGDDFEDEVTLDAVEVHRAGTLLHSRFLFTARGDGVFHRATITAVVDGQSMGTTVPVTIESRPSEECEDLPPAVGDGRQPLPTGGTGGSAAPGTGGTGSGGVGGSASGHGGSVGAVDRPLGNDDGSPNDDAVASGCSIGTGKRAIGPFMPLFVAAVVLAARLAKRRRPPQ